ncbi:hypothetical protein E2562_010775 [Oryza meyeriana var. granulata]|uniref:Uncharacterized protein n=1 Tax=Oryza meyeriana var. granulata TaxID=110450 RepID=A0A6G1BJ21_9ORYZ|nr:hypothetical protein E2562_010775 [Oryza meyeriana var. granulata]KAF0888058.1 hypothetical protein E2562_010775 [Oryza meyeriana var. granulata]
MAPAPAVDAEGEGGGGKSENTLKSEEGRVAVTARNLDSSDSHGLATGVLGGGGGGASKSLHSSDGQGRAVDVQGRSSAGESMGNMVVKSEPTCTDAPEGDDALLTRGTKPAVADPLAEASSSHDIDVVSSDPLNDEEEGDTTECSSSFGNSYCETDDEADHGDSEVNSPLLENADGDEASMRPRKKKVTAEWRSAVRPMLWRFQWLELRMKDLLSQVSKYDKELALIKKGKELQQTVNKTNGSRSESLQPCKGHENSCMERQKRTRHEETVDTSSYIKKHKILSYFYDKQNKGAETDGVLIDDDSSGPVGNDVKGVLHTVGLLEPKGYDMVAEQLTLQKVLLKIDGIQSQVLRLQDRLSKVRSKQENMISLVDHAHIKVVEKRLTTQKRSFSYKKDRYTKAQKKKNLTILLKEEDKPAHAVISTLSKKAPDYQTEVAKYNSEVKGGERCQSHKKSITVDLLLGVDSSLPNSHMGDLCKNNDDILIDNQAAKERYQPFENAKQLMDKSLELTEKVAETANLRGGNNSALVEVSSTSAPSKVENASVPLDVRIMSGPVVKQEPVFEKPPALKHVYSGKRRGRKFKMEGRGPVAGSKTQSKEASKTPATKQKTESTFPAAKKLKIEKTIVPVEEEKTEQTRSTGKKRKAGKSCSSTKKQEAEKSASAARKDISETTPSKPRIEKAVLVAVNSRRSQRVRKPKIY